MIIAVFDVLVLALHFVSYLLYFFASFMI